MGFYCFYYGLLGCLERTGFNFGISVFLVGFGEFFGHATGSITYFMFSLVYSPAEKEISHGCQ